MKDWILKYDGSRIAKVRHAILWICFGILFSMVMATNGNWSRYLLFNVLNIFIIMIAYYTLRYWQIPYLYKKKKNSSLFVLSIAGMMMLCYCLYWVLRITIVEKYVIGSNFEPFKQLGEFLIKVLRFYSPTIVLLVWEYQHNRKRDLIRIRALEKEKITSELKFLKAQINPHFLFNTLNNLYSFVLTESPKASDMLTRLTGILKYAFDTSQQGEVPLQLEVNTISDYLELEKIRYGGRLDVQYQSNGDFELPVSPLIILSIIENAFKHGASGDIDEPKIDIDIQTIDRSIHCRVWNTKSAHHGEINDEYKSGIGLSNIRRQLDLIYPERHELRIDDQSDTFTLTLSINTAA